MPNKKITWDSLYEKTDLTSLVKKIDFGIKQKKNLLEYYPWLKILLKNKVKVDKCLEIGCGSGAYSLVLKKLGIVKEVCLLDWSEEALKKAKRLFDYYDIKAKFVVGDARNLPFKDKSFDLVISGGLLEHFKDREIEEILKEEKRVARYVLNQVPINSGGYWLLRIAVTILKLGWPFGYEKPINVSDLKRKYIKNGIAIIDSSYHDILTAFKYNFFMKNLKKTKINDLLKNEIAILGKNKI